jgi:hypothetical protein
VKKYITQKYSHTITEVEVVRETAKRVVVLEKSFRLGGEGAMVERSASRDSEYKQYHDTWEEAHAYLLNRSHDKMEYARAQLADAAKEQAAVMALTRPQ